MAVSRRFVIPLASNQWVNSDGQPTAAFYRAMSALQALNLGPFTRAANDADAAKAGVPVNGIYQDPATGFLRGRVS